MISNLIKLKVFHRNTVHEHDHKNLYQKLSNDGLYAYRPEYSRAATPFRRSGSGDMVAWVCRYGGMSLSIWWHGSVDMVAWVCRYGMTWVWRYGDMGLAIW